MLHSITVPGAIKKGVILISQKKKGRVGWEVGQTTQTTLLSSNNCWKHLYFLCTLNADRF